MPIDCAIFGSKSALISSLLDLNSESLFIDPCESESNLELVRIRNTGYENKYHAVTGGLDPKRMGGGGGGGLIKYV
jgi:hypothetical protein